MYYVFNTIIKSCGNSTAILLGFYRNCHIAVSKDGFLLSHLYSLGFFPSIQTGPWVAAQRREASVLLPCTHTG